MLRVLSALVESESPGRAAAQRHARELARAHPPAAFLQSERSQVCSAISEAAFGGCKATTAGVRPSFWRHSSETILRRVTVLYSGLTDAENQRAKTRDTTQTCVRNSLTRRSPGHPCKKSTHTFRVLITEIIRFS